MMFKEFVYILVYFNMAARYSYIAIVNDFEFGHWTLNIILKPQLPVLETWLFTYGLSHW